MMPQDFPRTSPPRASADDVVVVVWPMDRGAVSISGAGYAESVMFQAKSGHLLPTGPWPDLDWVTAITSLTEAVEELRASVQALQVAAPLVTDPTTIGHPRPDELAHPHRGPSRSHPRRKGTANRGDVRTR